MRIVHISESENTSRSCTDSQHLQYLGRSEGITKEVGAFTSQRTRLMYDRHLCQEEVMNAKEVQAGLTTLTFRAKRRKEKSLGEVISARKTRQQLRTCEVDTRDKALKYAISVKFTPWENVPHIPLCSNRKHPLFPPLVTCCVVLQHNTI